ncbi:MAG: hypothetical protein IPN84_07370 [Sphingomonadales bacterium]|jgi:ABC-type uncharacterized transport system permease subunit|nr:hypothetical protein [Sphingomonadales bacterium]
MSEQQEEAAGLSPFNGFLVLLLIVAAIVGWILIGSKFLGVTSFFASFLFLWYWAAVEQADYGQWTQSVVGALVGLLLAWQSAWLGVHYGQNGMIAGIVIMLAAIYVQVMNWVPIAINRSTMLYLTVLSAPAILMGKDFNPVEVSIAIVGGAVFFAGVVKLAFLYAARNAKG